MDRRDFISILGGTVAAAMYSCKPPEQKIVPLVNPVEYMKPGAIDYISTVYCHGNVSYGALVKTYEGRPIKIEGNELHPMNKGGTSPQMQASIYSLYDPIRFRKPRIADKEVNIDKAIDFLKQKIQSAIKNNEQIRVIIDEHCSPSYLSLINLIANKYPNVKFITLPPVISGTGLVNKRLLGIDGKIVPDLSKAEFVLSVGSDFLGTDNTALFHRSRYGANQIVTLDSISTFTKINSVKSENLPYDEIECFLLNLVMFILENKYANSFNSLRNKIAPLVENCLGIDKDLENYLLTKQGKCAVLTGEYLSDFATSLGILINYLLGNYNENCPLEPKYIINDCEDKLSEIKQFQEELKAGIIKYIFYLEVNPKYFLDESFNKLLSSINKNNQYSISIYPNETSQDCILDIPATHYIESWGDATNLDGSLSIQQAVISPLNENSISKENLLIKIFNIDNKLFNNEQFTYYDFIKQNHKEISSNQPEWENLLRNGVKHYEEQKVTKCEFNLDNFSNYLPKELSKKDSNKLYCQLHPSNNLLFGLNSNIPYLYELPDPVTTQVWSHAALINNATLQSSGIKSDKTIIINGIEIPVLIIDNIAINTIALPLGFGKNNIGINGFKLRKNYLDSSPFPVEIQIGKNKNEIILSQLNNNISGKDLLQISKINSRQKTESINPNYKYNSYRWGMVIDLAKCIGCNSCVVACQIENNIPVVGREEAKNGRLMHWIRHDKYNSDKEFLSIPILCQHCENAPCESVCPVSASTHSPEGLNETTYNRCIGARYCMANCPYKVRKFNFFNYNENIKKPLNMLLNPQVTVRMRGVVEKCTFCVQRINEAKYKAKDIGLKRIPDGQLKTACQQACPTGAIIFGDLNDTESQVYKLSKSERAIKLLEELNTNPSVVYLRKS
jgi:Fe-S-cluster-containing dehydrogenase component